MNELLKLRSVSEKEVEAHNALYCAPLEVQAIWLGHAWHCKFGPIAAPDVFPVHISVAWGGAKAIVRGELHWFEQVTESLMGKAVFGQCPPLVQIALAEAAFRELAQCLEAFSKKPVQIMAIHIAGFDEIVDAELQKLSGMGWRAECNGFLSQGELWLDAKAVGYAVEMAASVKRHARRWSSWKDLPLPIHFLLGHTSLAVRTFEDLSLNDVVLLDECWLKEEDCLTVAVGHGAAFRGRLANAQLTVMDNLKIIMQEPSYEALTDMDEAGDQLIDGLPIKLTFDLGERMMALGALQSLEPGYVFDLGRDLRQAVIIRANGMRVGEGELVDIQGRTGVVVLSLAGKTQ